MDLNAPVQVLDLSFLSRLIILELMNLHAVHTGSYGRRAHQSSMRNPICVNLDGEGNVRCIKDSSPSDSEELLYASQLMASLFDELPDCATEIAMRFFRDELVYANWSSDVPGGDSPGPAPIWYSRGLRCVSHAYPQYVNWSVPIMDGVQVRGCTQKCGSDIVRASVPTRARFENLVLFSLSSRNFHGRDGATVLCVTQSLVQPHAKEVSRSLPVAPW